MQDVPPIPTSWEEFLSIKPQLGALPGQYLRHKEDQLFYDLYRQHLSKEDFLAIITQQMLPDRVKLLLNRFPYTNFLQHLPDVAHYCLWSLDGPLSEAKIQEEIVKKFPTNEWMEVESAPVRKSVPEIWHTHIFINGIKQYEASP
jgi:hypothetical protein